MHIFNSPFLVSIIVITYNSEDYILETLNSIKAQSYSYIELIISDDCSTDRTLHLCSEWLSENKSRFARTQIVEVMHNTGIASNCNRGAKHAKGEWIKFIAGDDILAYSAIEKFVFFVNESLEAVSIVCGIVVDFDDNFSLTRLNRVIWDEKLFSGYANADNQFRRLAIANRIPAVGVIIKRNCLLDEFGGFDERFQMLEDYPLWIKLTHNGVKIFGMREIVAYYRIHSNSIFGCDLKGSPKLINSNFKLHHKYEKEFLSPILPLTGRIGKRFDFYMAMIIVKLGNNANNKFLKLLFVMKNKLNPMYISELFKV
jgi:alpha-1,3-rhamnosyltransferase